MQTPNALEPQVSPLLNTQLLSRPVGGNDVYSLLDKQIQIADLHPTFRAVLEKKAKLQNLGIDLPLSFGNINNPKKTMLVALDPKRAGQKGLKIWVGSIFSLHKEEGRSTKENDYWPFVSYLAQNSFVYLTDIYKIYYETYDSKGALLLSNKDVDFTYGASYQHSIRILDQEINTIVRPQRIVTLGKEAAQAVKRIKGIQTDELTYTHGDITYIFLPHISRRVTQNIKTVGALFKGLGIITNQPDMEDLGNAILGQSKLRQMLGAESLELSSVL